MNEITDDIFYERTEFSSLYEAHRMSRRSKRDWNDVILFEMNLSLELVRIQYELRSGNYRPRPYERFIIHDPKERIIYALKYRDRIVQHSLCDNVIAPRMERRLIYDNAASRTYHYFRYEPIKWRVLNVDQNYALLLADQGLDDQRYNKTSTSITWEKSTIRSWLNGYGSSVNSYGTDYSSNNFIGSAFSSSEQNAILSTTLDNSSTGSYSSSYGGNNTTDKVFLLASYDVYNTSTAQSYGFANLYSTCDEARRAKSSTYAKAMGTSSSDSLGNCWWWLRSPGCFSIGFGAAHVNVNGYVCYLGNSSDSDNGGVCRPALNLNLSSSNLYTYAGTVCSDGTVDEQASPTPTSCTHNYQSEITKEATCTTTGIKTYTCSKCGDSYTEEIAVTGHSWNSEATVDVKATCTKAGSQSIHCSKCDATKDSETIDALGHDYQDVDGTAKAATCTDEGTRTYTCSRCNDSYTEEIPATGHNWDEGTVTKKASCEEEGTIIYTCATCKEKKSEGIAATDHSWDTEPTVDIEPTCTKTGFQSIHCSKCDATKEVESIAKIPHEYDEGTVTKKASCTTRGVITYSCVKCGAKKEVETSVLGHKWDETPTIDKEATCTEEGSKSVHCTRCSATCSEKVIPATGHSWGFWITTKEATVSDEGIQQRSCSVCNATETKSIAKLPTPTPEVVTPDKAPSSNPVSQDQSDTVGKDTSVVDKKITSTKSDEIKGAVFQLLQVKWKSIGTTSLSIQWKKVTGATKYIVYGAACGSKFKKLKPTTSLYYTQKSLKKGTYYKYFVVAVKGNTVMATSKTIHLATSGGKVGNDKSIKLNKTSLSLAKGKYYTLKATLTPYSKKLTVKKHRSIAYESSNPAIVKVISGGKIKAIKKGTCYVYAYAQDGIFAKAKVTVK